MSKPFTAQFPGECGHGDRIRVGELVRFDEDDRLVHINCAIELPDDDRSRICGKCSMIHVGECL